MSGIEVKLSPTFYKRIKKRYENYQMEVGILEDKPHFDPVYVSPLGHGEKTSKKGKVTRITDPYKTVAGGPARKLSGTSGKTVGEVFKDVQEKTGIDILRTPFQLKTNLDVLKMLNNFFKFVGSPSVGKNEQRLINTLQAVVRNPITKGAYGSNKRGTAAAKGFNRLLIDTGQVFQNIKARIISGRGK